jgi:hypothetical protein
MSLELIDQILESWKDPNYEGITNNFTFNIVNDNLNEKIIKDIEQIRYLKPNTNKLNEYSKDKQGLIQFYKDHNFIYASSKKIHKAYNMLPFPSQYELDQINKYLTKDIKFIMQIGFEEGLRSLNFLENSKAHLIIFSDFKQEYSYYGRYFIEEIYPLRHTTILGLTKNSISNFSLDKEPHIKFDLIYCGDNKKYYEMYEDIFNCVKYTHDNTILILSNVCPHISMDSYAVMNRLIKEGIISLVEHIKIPGKLGDYTRGIAILKFNKTENIMDISVYKNIEIKIPLYELSNYIDDHINDLLDIDLINAYVDKITKAGIKLDNKLEKIIQEYSL